MADPRRFLLAVLLAACAAAACAQDLSSQRDYSDPAQRDRPIACMPGDIEGHPGRTLGELFGADWPAQPAPATPDAYAPPRLLKRGAFRFPRGLYPEETLNVVAVLVGADGKPLKAEVLCSTRMGLDTAVRRALLGATFAPATLDGRAVTAVLVVVERFRPVIHTSARTPRQDL